MSGVKRIAIVGAGSIGWLAACALKRALRHRELDVCVVGQGSPATEPRTRWTLPSLRGFHALLGVAEPEFLRAADATFRLGSEHRHWQGDASAFIHAHGDLGADLSGTPFYKYLLHQALSGRPFAPEEFSLAALAGLSGRFARPMGDERALTSSFTYGYHLDDRGYAAFLSRHAARLGVRHADAVLEAVEVDGGSIRSLSLAGGEKVSADLYLDCSGRAAVLLSRLETSPRIDWRDSLPCDRNVVGFAAANVDAPALTQTLAIEQGWLWRIPLATRTAFGFVHSSADCDIDAARRTLEQTAGPLQDLVTETFTQGRRAAPWVRNCIALGSAAIELEPLAGVDLQAAALGIGALIELFPIADVGDVEAREYNRVMAEHADGLRDFTLAHYHVGAPRAGAFWSRARSAPLPDRLAHKLDLFFANGRIELLDFESFEELDWAWLLLGGRRHPSSMEIQIRERVAQIRPEQVAPLREQVARLVSTMPRHMDYVRQQHAHKRQ
jgi:tryptophan halogenase